MVNATRGDRKLNPEELAKYVQTIRSPEAILALPDEDFFKVVDAELRNVGGNRLRTILQDPRLLDRWWLVLVQMKKSVEGQLGARADDVERLRDMIDSGQRPTHEEMDNGLSASADDDAVRAWRFDRHRSEYTSFLNWRATAKRFKTGVEERLLEIRRRRLAAPPAKDVQQGIETFNSQALVVAIRTHRDRVMAEFDEDVSDADRALWGVLDLIGT